MYRSTLFFLQLPVVRIEFKSMHSYEFLMSGKKTKSHLNKINKKVSTEKGEDLTKWTIYYYYQVASLNVEKISKNCRVRDVHTSFDYHYHNLLQFLPYHNPKLYIPSSIKTQMNFVLVGQIGPFGSTENFCSFAQVTYF